MIVKKKKTSWAKSTIFINKPVSALLKDAGNIPVDRKNKDNQKLFSGTFEVLKLNEAVAIFPEGTSYTEPRLQEIKDGASWVGFSPIVYNFLPFLPSFIQSTHVLSCSCPSFRCLRGRSRKYPSPEVGEGEKSA